MAISGIVYLAGGEREGGKNNCIHHHDPFVYSDCLMGDTRLCVLENKHHENGYDDHDDPIHNDNHHRFYVSVPTAFVLQASGGSVSDFCRCVDYHAMECDFYIEANWQSRAEKAEAEVKQLREACQQVLDRLNRSSVHADTVLKIKKALSQTEPSQLEISAGSAEFPTQENDGNGKT